MSAQVVFADDSLFVTRDNRRGRPLLPVTAESLNRRHGLLFPPKVVAGRSVLDLGCCIGATGHWCMTLGAARYTGVEHQAGYARQAARLLRGWSAARVVRRDAVSFAAADRGRYDVVAMLGVAHGLYDPLALIRDAAACARRYFCFEDFGPLSGDPVLVPWPGSRMNVAGEAAEDARGFGWRISAAAMEAIMAFLGFAADIKPVARTAERWLCRYVRVGAPAEAAAYSETRVPWKR